VLGYKSDELLVWRQGNVEIELPIEAYEEEQPPVSHTFIHSNSSGKKYYRNNALVYEDASETTPLVSFNEATIGNLSDSNYYKGIIGEIAIYHRALGAKEIEKINNYITEKWATVVKIKEGTACVTSSPGYLTIANSDNWGSTSTPNGGTLAFAGCTSGFTQIGTIDDLDCNNGVYTGDTSGSCVTLDCATDPNTTNTLSDGTWDSTSATYLQVVTGTCDSGYTGSPTITRDTGNYTNETSSCIPITCAAHMPNVNGTSIYVYEVPAGTNCVRVRNQGWSNDFNKCLSDGRWYAHSGLKNNPPAGFTYADGSKETITNTFAGCTGSEPQYSCTTWTNAGGGSCL
jgi:hypothetical protein